MKLATFGDATGPMRLGAVIDRDRLLDVTRAAGDDAGLGSMLDLLDQGQGAKLRVQELVDRVHDGDTRLQQWVLPMESVRLFAPIPRPRKNVFAVGLNYRSHVEQNAVALGLPIETPKVPLFFSKPVTAVVGPGDPIYHDRRLTSKLDYEVELGVIIGRRGSWISPSEALDYVFGYTLVNDVSARDLQWRTSQMFYGKGLDSFCPVGPYIVDAPSMPSLNQVVIELYVNGERRQSEPAGHMLVSIPAIIGELSRGLTLEPGDIIATGTPGGCGYQMIPPRFLTPGDIVECRADAIGALKNTVVAVRP